jgi:MinD-like ATPase involved in chromosome partitioning or flagellar assembly
MRRFAVNLPQTGRIYTIFSPKGGVGKTSIAVNLADRAVSMGLKTLLLELDSSPGDLRLILNSSNHSGILAVLHEFDLVEEVCHLIRERFYFLPGPASPEEGEALSYEAVGKFLSKARVHFDAIVIDTPSTLTETTATAIKFSDNVFFVVEPTLAAAARAETIINFLKKKLDISTVGFRIIINKRHRRDNLRLESLLNFTELPVISVIKYDSKFINRMNTLRAGNLPQSTIAREAENILRDFYPMLKTKQGLLSRLWRF